MAKKSGDVRPKITLACTECGTEGCRRALAHSGQHFLMDLAPPEWV